MKVNIKKIFFLGSLFSFLFLLDRITKLFALTYLPNNDIVVFRFLNLSFVWNQGVSWGMFNQAPQLFKNYFLAAFIGCIIVFFILHTIKQLRDREPIFFEISVLAGALSNFFDRMYYGAVIDFFDFHILDWHWPVLNIADICIVIGIGGIIARGVLWTNKKIK